MKPNGYLNILTIDANLGQNSIQQAKVFTQTVGINGLILTKFDGTAKGGAIIPICNELKLPVLYLGVGEGVEDLVGLNHKPLSRHFSHKPINFTKSARQILCKLEEGDEEGTGKRQYDACNAALVHRFLEHEGSKYKDEYRARLV